MESKLQSFQESLNAKNLNNGDQYRVNGVLSYVLNWRGNDETTRKNAVRVLKPVRTALQRVPGVTNDARGGRLRATLEVILTKIFPLLVPKHPGLQYYVDMWKNAEETGPSVDPMQISISTTEYVTFHGETSHPCIVRHHQELVSLFFLVIQRFPIHQLSFK